MMYASTDPPDPIDNSKIASVKNGQTIVRPSSDYGQLSTDMWKFLYEIYGGSPELILKPGTQTLESQAKASDPGSGDAGNKMADTKL